MIPYVKVCLLLIYCMIKANFHRYRVCLIVDRNQGCCWIVLPIRQDHDPPFLRLRYRRVATRGLQAREELAQDADGVLCARRQGSGDGWAACSRAEWPWRIGRRGRDERVRHLQRWCVGRSKRYVPSLLFFSFSPIPHHNHSALHCISATRSEERSSPSPKSHTTPPSWTQGSFHPSPSIEEGRSGQQYLPAHLQTRRTRGRQIRSGVCDQPSE